MKPGDASYLSFKKMDTRMCISWKKFSCVCLSICNSPGVMLPYVCRKEKWSARQSCSDIIYICCGMLAEWNYWQVTWYFAKPSVSSCRYLLESFVEIFHEASAGCIISDKFIDCVKVVECNEKYFRRPLYHRKLVFYRHRHQIKQFVHGGCAIKIHFVQAFNKSSKVCTVQYLDWTNKIE